MNESVKILSANGNRIITLDDLIKEYGINMELYEVLKFKANVYEGQQKDKNDEPVILQLHQVSAEFKPIHPLVDKQEVLLKLFGDKIPVIENRHNIKDTGVLANIMQTDVHFDRLEHNSKKYLQALDDTTMRLLDDVMKFDPERILYANMGDYFNTDGNHKTTKGTEQRNSMNEKDSFKMGLEHQLKTIEMLSSVLPTDVIYVSGNHDDDKLQYLSDAVDLYYRNNDNVTIDNNDHPRKYYEWGDNTLGYSHGDKVKDKDILSLMSMENTLRKYNYYFKGHIHHQLKQMYGNLIVETLGSPAIPNEYEKKFGYIGDGKVSAKLFDKKNGKIGEFERKLT